jgi:hypothetical protein
VKTDDLDMRLASLERWWRETGNPLYVWEAIAICRREREPIPE